jgi:predicted MFS family arabinose efflux permease
VSGLDSPARETGLRYSLRAFRHRAFRIFWSAALVSNTGSWLANLTVPYVLYDLTHSALWVGLAALAQFLPGVVMAPYGGALADRHDRRRVLLATQAGLVASAVALWALWASGVHDRYAILALVALAGTFQGLNLPAWQAFVHDLVPRQDLASAVGLNSLQLNAARAIGPAVAGVLLATLGPGWAFLFNAASFAFVIAALLLVHTTVVIPRQPRSSALKGFVSAVRYVGGQPGIQSAILVSVLVGVLGNPVFGFTVVFAGGVFHVGPVGLGLLNAVLGIGSVIAALIVTSSRGSLGRTVRWAFLLFALGMGGFAAAPNAWIGGFALAVVGGCFLAVISSANTAMQLIVADDMRGRVLAVRIMFFTLSFPVGALSQGWVSDRIGPRAAVLGAAGVMLLVGLFLALWRGGRILHRLDDPHDEAVPCIAESVPAGTEFSTLRHNGWSPDPPESSLHTVPPSRPRSEKP